MRESYTLREEGYAIKQSQRKKKVSGEEVLNDRLTIFYPIIAV